MSPGRAILLVDDDPDQLEITIYSLRRGRLANPIQLATNAREALDYLFCRGPHEKRATGNPALVLLDLSLRGGMSGIGVLKALRMDERTASLPVVILSGSAAARDLEETARLGVSAFVEKPLAFADFCTIVEASGMSWILYDGAPPER